MTTPTPLNTEPFDNDDPQHHTPLAPQELALENQDVKVQNRILKIANVYGITNPEDPTWLLVRAVSDAERAASGTSSAVSALESARLALDSMPDRIEKSAANASAKIEGDLAHWGTTAAAIVSARLRAMLVDLMPEVERHAKSSMNELSTIVNALSIDIGSIEAKMRAAFGSAQSRYRDDIADTARNLIQAELVKTNKREHRKSLLHNAVALTIAAGLGAGLFFGVMVYNGEYSPLPVYRINGDTFDLLPSSQYGMSIQKMWRKALRADTEVRKLKHPARPGAGRVGIRMADLPATRSSEFLLVARSQYDSRDRRRSR
jgi:hypothetical protein